MNLNHSIIHTLTKYYPESLKISSLAIALNSSEKLIYTNLQRLKKQRFPVIISGNSIRLTLPLLSSLSIKQELAAKKLGEKITLFDSLNSTNSYAKEHLHDLSHGGLILAHEQTVGKGRLGRVWSSPIGKSISMSLILKPKNHIRDVSLLTQLTAAALTEALKDKVEVQIKWPNDVLVNKKKVAGILTETEFSGGKLSGIVIGVGINTNLEYSDFPDELHNKADSIREIIGHPVDPNELIADFLNHFEALYDRFIQTGDANPFLAICRDHSVLIGREMWIEENSNRRKAFIETIDKNGALVVTFLDTNQTEAITSTHFSIRGEDSYV